MIPTDPETAQPPQEMLRDEYLWIVRSQIGRVVFALALGAAGFALGLSGHISFGAVPSGILGFGLGYGIGGKFFPDSGGVLSRRFRNYRRAQRGKDPLPPEDDVEGKHFDDFRRG